MKATRRYAAALAAIVTATAGLLAGTSLAAGAASAGSFPAFVGPLHQVSTLASTVPGNGDVNPYGVAVVPRSTGNLGQGNVLVSNFNDKANTQGTGSTIVQVTPRGHVTLFAQVSRQLPGCPGGVGLTTALVALRSGWVIVGSLPTQNGAVSGPGCLIVLDQWGHVRETFAGRGINGPWDMTALDLGGQAALFVTNVLNGTVAAKGGTVFGGTVLRLIVRIPRDGLPWIQFRTIIGSGFPEKLDPAALVIGPTGVGLGRNGVLYVADTLASRVGGIRDAVFRGFSAGRGFTVSRGNHLNGPLGLVIAPNGNILTVNSGDGNLVEITPSGFQIAVRTLDTSGSPPGPAPCSGWRSSRSTAPSTSWTTPPTPSTCCTDQTPPRRPHPGAAAAPGPPRPIMIIFSWPAWRDRGSISAISGNGQRVTPTRTGSAARETPNAARTPSLISRASAISAAVLADPELTRASVCFAEIRAPSPGS